MIASWSVTTTNPPSPVVGTTATHVSTAELARSAALTANSSGSTYSSSGWATAPGATPAVDVNYVAFRFTVEAGYTASITQFDFRARSATNGPGTMGFYVSADNYASPLFTLAMTATDTNYSKSLSLTGLTGIVEFRFIEIGNLQQDQTTPGTATGAGTFRVSNVSGSSATPMVFTGTVSAIPVPTPLALPGGLALMAFGSAAGRRRR
ncbi:MAG: hypothetical protein GC162_06870 [Planctomycetes bacterium]|nr:hypothetical protein [Planctomycetota bacterium]